MLRLVSLATSAFVLSIAIADARPPDYESAFDTIRIELEDGGPLADIGHFEYVVPTADPATRPVTFVFNGGPGASSIYLHMLGIGPKILETSGDGGFLDATGRLVDNPHTWLPFTDLVFVDPVGTGLSRAVTQDGEVADGTPFWNAEADIRTIGLFIRKWLSENRRWMSPVVVAGESYGGTRVAELAGALMADFDVRLDRAILMSPHLADPMVDVEERYGVLAPALILPTYAATAAHHDVGAEILDGDDLRAGLAAVEDYALGDYMLGLAHIGGMTSTDAEAFFRTLSAITGLSLENVRTHRGRITIGNFAKNLLPTGRVLDIYDGSQAYADPFADTMTQVVLPESLIVLSSRITPAAFPYFQDVFEIENVQDYITLNYDAYWSVTDLDIGHSTDLAAALSLDDQLAAFVAHGMYDMVTPYFRTDYLLEQSVIGEAARDRVDRGLYPGGHMFYLNADGRTAFFEDISAFFDYSGERD